MKNLLITPEVTCYYTRNVEEARELGFFKFEYVYAVFDIENRETFFEDRVVYCVDRAYMMDLLNSWNCSSKKIFSELNIFPKFIYKYYLNRGYVPVKLVKNCWYKDKNTGWARSCSGYVEHISEQKVTCSCGAVLDTYNWCDNGEHTNLKDLEVR